MITKKEISNGSSGIQAEGDINITLNHGLTVDEVKNLVELYLTQNFPRLREDAMHIAQENVNNLMAEFKRQLETLQFMVDLNKFKEPDVQYSINEATIGVAKRGDAANIEMLTALLLERVRVDTSDIFSLACSEAIKILPRINKSHINYMSLAYFFDHMIVHNLNSLSDLEASAKLVQPIIADAGSLSGWNVQYLIILQCLYHHNLGRASVYSMMSKKYPAVTNLTEKQIKTEIQKTTYLKNAVEAYDSKKMNFQSLTLVGQIIACLNINKYIPQKKQMNEFIK